MVPRLPCPTALSQQVPAQIEGQQRSPDFRRSQHLQMKAGMAPHSVPRLIFRVRILA
jgi:hypothetical protein